MKSQGYIDRASPTVWLPQLDKPQSEYRYQRKMYAFHKNMHSAGFIIGTDSVTQKYRDAVVAAYRGKDLWRKELPQPPTHIRSASEARLLTPALEEIQHLRQQLKAKEGELEHAKAIQLSVEASPQRRSPPPLNAKDLYALSRSMDQVSKPGMSLELRNVRKRQRVVPLDMGPPKARNDNSLVLQLAAHPVFNFQRYTKMHPRGGGSNPITGIGQMRSGSAMRDWKSSDYT